MPKSSDSVWLHRYAVLLAAATFCLIIAGALVTSNDAGLAVPDWPLSYGKLMPPMVGGIFYEHGHRMVATTVGMLTIGMVFFLWAREERRWVRRLGLVGLVAVIAQGLLGGITVLFFLPPAVSIAHASLAQFFFCITVSLAVFTSPAWKDAPPPQESPEGDRVPLFHLAAATTIAVYIQLILGAGLRHGVLAVMPHVGGALVVSVVGTLTVFRVVSRHFGQPGLRRPALALATLLPAQVMLGIASYWARFMRHDVQPLPVPVALKSAHVAVGALVLAASLVLVLRSRRLLAPVGTPLEVAEATSVVAR